MTTNTRFSYCKFFQEFAVSQNEIVTKPNITNRQLKDELMLVHINTRSIGKKFTDLFQFVEDFSYNVVAVSERWLVPNMPSKPYLIPNVNLFKNDRNENGGGVMLYIKVKFQPKTLLNKIMALINFGYTLS